MLSVQSYFIHVFVNTHSFKYKGCWDCLWFFIFCFFLACQFKWTLLTVVSSESSCRVFIKLRHEFVLKKNKNLCLSWSSICISEASRLKWTIQLAPTCLCNGVIETWMALPTVFTQTRVQADVSCGDGCWRLLITKSKRSSFVDTFLRAQKCHDPPDESPTALRVQERWLNKNWIHQQLCNRVLFLVVFATKIWSQLESLEKKNKQLQGLINVWTNQVQPSGCSV